MAKNNARARMRVPNTRRRSQPDPEESRYLRPAQVDAMAELFVQELVPQLVETIKPHLVKLYDDAYGSGFEDGTNEGPLEDED